MTVGISFDIAPTHSAYIVWDDERFLTRDNFAKKKCLTVEMSRWLTREIKIWDIHKNVEWVAAEKSIYIQNARNTINLGKLLGAIEITCDQLGIKFFEGTTAEIDSACGIEHSGRKQYTESLAKNIFQLPKDSTEDECDAIAVGIWGWGKFKEWITLQNGLDISK